MNIKNILFFVFLSFTLAVSQNELNVKILDSSDNKPLSGANVFLQNTAIGGSSDLSGMVHIENIPDGQHIIVYEYVGYQTKKDTLTFPVTQSKINIVYLTAEQEETETVFVTATRSSRSIADTPTRVETISGEELNEKANMKPGDIRMLLNESTGIQTQQTSATSANASIRIQGLDGRYTQMLRDGFPLYSGFSGGLSLLQIVPLDLQQAEVIKGSSSTLYGGDAIAGLVNLVSKVPGDSRELSFLLNATSAGGFDGSGFYAKKFETIGVQAFASYNAGRAYDPADIGLSAIPEFQRITVNPKLFFYFNDQTDLYIGLNSTIEKRTGGDMEYIAGRGDSIRSYFEKNNTTRYSTQLGFNHRTNNYSKFTFKNTLSFYDRSITMRDYKFSGDQLSTYSEAVFSTSDDRVEWIAGLNLWTDQFSQDREDTIQVIDYKYITPGAFIQNSWNTTEKFTIESGFRLDYNNEYGVFALPRAALLFKSNPQLSFRLGGGMGYKLPTVFTEDAERIQFRGILPIDVANTHAEKSYGFNFDLNFRTIFLEDFTFSINGLLFYTRILDPLVLSPLDDEYYEFQQPDGYIDTDGIELNLKFTYEHYKLFIGYTFSDVNEHYEGNSELYPLVARHRLNNVLIYEVEEKFRIGLEAYYFSPQHLNDGRIGQEYWITGVMTEKMWENFSIFLNFENFLDTRQTRFEDIFTGTITDPVFNDIYAPLDGFVVNGGVKFKL